MSIYATSFDRVVLGYQRSHVLPANDDARTGYVELAVIPGFVARKGRRKRNRGTVWPFLRLRVNGEVVVLTPRDARELAEDLGEWLRAID